MFLNRFDNDTAVFSKISLFDILKSAVTGVDGLSTLAVITTLFRALVKTVICDENDLIFIWNKL
jgi:hypothetical protein